jgi:hypothetical protein
MFIIFQNSNRALKNYGKKVLAADKHNSPAESEPGYLSFAFLIIQLPPVSHHS